MDAAVRRAGPVTQEELVLLARILALDPEIESIEAPGDPYGPILWVAED